MFIYFNKNKYYIKNRGMTLVELLVVLSIFIMITSTVVYDYSNFKSSTSTQNLSNDIALSIRKAQISAIGVRGVGAVFDYGHGIHFTDNINTSYPVSGSNKSFVLFTDLTSNNKYDYNSQSNISDCGNTIIECEEIITINGLDEISTIYLDGIAQTRGGMLDIVFRRPNPDALFCYRSSISSSCLTDFSYVQVKVVKNQDGASQISRIITIWNTGQISAK